ITLGLFGQLYNIDNEDLACFNSSLWNFLSSTAAMTVKDRVAVGTHPWTSACSTLRQCLVRVVSGPSPRRIAGPHRQAKWLGKLKRARRHRPVGLCRNILHQFSDCSRFQSPAYLEQSRSP